MSNGSPCYKRPSIFIQQIAPPLQPPPLRAIAQISHLRRNLGDIQRIFPDISFHRIAIEKRQKFKWRACAQIEKAKKTIAEWECKLAEYESLGMYDEQYVDLKRQLRVFSFLCILIMFLDC